MHIQKENTAKCAGRYRYHFTTHATNRSQNITAGSDSLNAITDIDILSVHTWPHMKTNHSDYFYPYIKVINLIEKDFGIDKNNIISTGISNGGHMVYKLAYEVPNSTFLYAPLVANLPIKNNNDCDISEVEVNMAIFNGTNDQINPYDGGLVSLLGNDAYVTMWLLSSAMRGCWCS